MKVLKNIILLILLLSTTQSFAQNKSHAQAQKRTIFTGVASYYHPKFHGRRMANGERHSKDGLTGASNTLPMHKWVKVTNTRNGRSVIVKITDRMAKRNKRLIDLSYASAKKLGMTDYGIVRVKIQILPEYPPRRK